MGCGISYYQDASLRRKDKYVRRVTGDSGLSADAKIAIIGAGVTGVLTAQWLKRSGYKNVVMFEKREKVGGQADTMVVDGKAYDLSTKYIPILTTHDEGPHPAFKKILEEYKEELIITQPPVTWYYKNKEFSNIPPCLAGFERKKIILDMIKGFEVADVFNQYPGIHEVLDKGLTRKGETFYEWGVRKELQALTTLGAYLSDMFGAGPALEHSAAQALSYRQHYIVPYLWKIVRAALDKAEGLDALKLQFLKTFKTHPKLKEYLDKPDGEIPGGQYALKNGYQPLLQKIIAKDKTEVRLSCPVTGLEWGEAKEEVGGGKKKQTKKKIGWLVTTTMVESEGQGEDEKKSELRNKQNDGGDDNEAKNGSDKDSNAAAATTGTPTTTTTATTTATTTTEAFDCVIVCGLGKFDFLPPKHPAKELLSMMKVNPGLETWLVELESWDEERFGKTNSIVFGERTTNFGTRKGLPYDSRPYALSKDYADSNIVGCIAYPDDKLNKEEKEKLMREELKLELGASVKRIIGFRRFHWPVHVPPEAEKKDFFDKLHKLQGQRQLYFVGEAFSSAGVQACIDWIEEFMPWHFPMHNIAPSAK